jgi:hypothetical protein
MINKRLEQEKTQMGMNTNQQDISSLEFLQQRASLKQGAEGKANIFMQQKLAGWKKEVQQRNKLAMQKSLYANRLGTVMDA